MKSLLIALQFHHKAAEGRLIKRDPISDGEFKAVRAEVERQPTALPEPCQEASGLAG